METAKAKLTVLFDPPFWIGLFERERAGRYEACRVVFGGEPQDAQVYDLVLRRFHALRFSPAQPSVPRERREKHRSRNDSHAGPGTKAQRALSAQRELCRTQRQAESRQRRQAEQQVPQARRLPEERPERQVPWARKEQPAESECWAEAEYRPEWRGEVDYSYRKNNCAER